MNRDADMEKQRERNLPEPEGIATPSDLKTPEIFDCVAVAPDMRDKLEQILAGLSDMELLDLVDSASLHIKTCLETTAAIRTQIDAWSEWAKENQ